MAKNTQVMPEFIADEEIGQWEAAPDFIADTPQVGPVPQPQSFGQQAASNALGFGKGLVSGALQSINPIEIGKGLLRPDIAMEQQMQQGEEAFRTGKPIQGALRTAAASVPWVGPAAAGAVDTVVQFATSDDPQQMGEAVGGALGVAGMAKAAPMVGKAISERTSPYQMTTQRASKAMNRLTRSLAVPESEATRFIGGLKEGMPHIYEFSQREGRGWDSVKAFAQTARDASNDYYQKNYSELSSAFQDTKLPGAPIAHAIREIRSTLRPEQSKLRKSINELANQYGGKEFSLEQLEGFRKSLNGELEGMEALHNLDRSRLVKADPAAAAMERQQKTIRRLINTTLDDAGGRYEGSTAGVLRAYRSMVDVAERAERRHPSVALEEMERGGRRFGPETLVSPIRAVTLRQANPMAAAGGETAARTGTMLNRPDRLMQSARHLLDKRGIGPKGGGAIAQPISPKTRPPVQGDTVPIEVGPVPQPSLSGPIIPTTERRAGGTITQSEHRRSADQPIIQKASALKDAFSSAQAVGDKAAMTQFQDQLFALSQQHPWLVDYIRNRVTQFGVQRGSP